MIEAPAAGMSATLNRRGQVCIRKFAQQKVYTGKRKICPLPEGGVGVGSNICEAVTKKIPRLIIQSNGGNRHNHRDSLP